MKEGFSIAYGDVLMIICAFVFSLHILIIDYFSPKVDGVKLSCIQFFICGILCAVPMFVREKPAMGSILDAYLPLLYAGFSPAVSPIRCRSLHKKIRTPRWLRLY